MYARILALRPGPGRARRGKRGPTYAPATGAELNPRGRPFPFNISTSQLAGFCTMVGGRWLREAGLAELQLLNEENAVTKRGMMLSRLVAAAERGGALQGTATSALFSDHFHT